MSPFLASVLQLAVLFGVPPLVILAWRTTGAWLRHAAMGAATWAVALPLLLGIPTAVGFLTGSALAAAAALSITAGLTEESLRALLFRNVPSLRDPAAWGAAIMVGLGHGGLESWWFGLQAALGHLVLFVRPDLAPPGLEVPEASIFLIGAFSRPLLMLVHVGLSVTVWRSVVADRTALLLAAVGLHAALDLIAFCLPLVVPAASWVPGVAVLVAAAGALTAIRAFRPA